jgi:transposase
VVRVKNVEQQAILMMQRVRQGFVEQRTAQTNQMRGLLIEFGIVYPKGMLASNKIAELSADENNGIPERARQLFRRMYEYYLDVDCQVKVIEDPIKASLRETPMSQRLHKLPGIGYITASAIVASFGDARAFKSGRQMAAWLALVPRQYSSGGTPALRGISKRGDVYLRRLLVLGAHAVIRHLKAAPGEEPHWI